MCGRYSIDDFEEIVEMRSIIMEAGERYKGTPEHAAMKTGEIFPTNTVPVIAAVDKAPQVRLMKWGFPRFTGSAVIINARSETASEKSIFRGPVESKRCLVPSTGYYEWSHDTDKSNKRKFLIRTKETPMLYMAGIYNVFTDKDGKPVFCFVIITADANESVRFVHDRMPFILTGENKDVWLHDSVLSKVLLREKCETQLAPDLVSGI